MILGFLLAWSAFAAWVIFFGGADLLEGTFGSRLLVHFRAHRWKASGIKVYVGLLWLGFIILFLLWRLSIGQPQ
jgi:hypothetical protein